ncbi:MAG: hypothetical protein EOT05_01070 [Candidatus Microsaccharimonas sossegonensis]|uniref:O-antigen ligase-related domain-containing protein n=1 Tax=Candidatus Microsaccharimonas sossegonensis TaxID=2506948 RepID=A0A4Q0AH64_9BACT|nr:MAG: hypothetical protein EOT05_01070 [Candidatus Microsaccharimonas sossegonensis]
MVVKPKKTVITLTLLDTCFVGILLIIFGGIVLHAPLSVGLGTLFPSAELFIKSWKEILMLLAGSIMLVILHQKKRWDVLKSPLIYLIAAFAALHLVLLLVFPQGITATVAGLMIDLRYLFFFVLVYVAVCLYPSLRRTFVITFFVGAFVVAAFALLQVFVLPRDILTYIGYSNTTIAPFLTVDQNSQYIRINSTLRGPNPLGAYVIIVLSLLAAAWLKIRQVQPRRHMLALSVIVIGSLVALWSSYSRSALIATLVAIGIITVVVIGKRIPKKFWIILVVVIDLVAAAIFFGRSTNFVSNVVLHNNATTGATVDSNAGHAVSLSEGLLRLVRQPIGAGVGSTGSASLYGPQPLIVENQYLFIAHEAGWLGLIVFVVITVMVLRALWRRRENWLALGVFASGIGLVFVGLVLPVWVDDTVAIIWWGLAAVALAGKESHGRTINK